MLAAGMVAALAVPVVSGAVAEVGSHRPTPAPARPDLPVVFEPNVGQAGPEVGFVARGAGLAMALSPTGAQFRVGASGDATAPPAPVSLRLEGADPAATMLRSRPAMRSAAPASSTM